MRLSATHSVRIVTSMTIGPGPDRVVPADLTDRDEVVDIPRRPRGHDAVGVLPADGVEGRAGHVSRSTCGSGAHSSPSRPAGPARRSPLPTIIPVQIVAAEAPRRPLETNAILGGAGQFGRIQLNDP